MPIGEAAAENFGGAFWKEDALRAKQEFEEKRETSNKKYKMVKVSDNPPTWVEVEDICPEENDE